MKYFGYNIFPIICVVCATYLISVENTNWCWFIVLALCTAVSPSEGDQLMRNMTEIFEYNGYYGSIEVEENTTYGAVFYGKLLFMNDSITYESLDEGNLYEEFKLAVDDYVIICVELGKVPQRVKLIRGE